MQFPCVPFVWKREFKFYIYRYKFGLYFSLPSFDRAIHALAAKVHPSTTHSKWKFHTKLCICEFGNWTLEEKRIEFPTNICVLFACIVTFTPREFEKVMQYFHRNLALSFQIRQLQYSSILTGFLLNSTRARKTAWLIKNTCNTQVTKLTIQLWPADVSFYCVVYQSKAVLTE